MAGAGGAEVGRVSIRVVPNTDGFRTKLRQELERETAGLDVDIEANLTGEQQVVAEARATSEKAQAAAKDVEVELDLDTRKFIREFESTVRAAEAAMGNIESDIDLDQAEFLAGIEAMVDMAEAALERIDAGVDLDPTEFMARLKALAATAEAALGDIDVELTPQARGFAQAVASIVEMTEAATRALRVQIDLDNKQFLREIYTAIRAAEQALGKIDSQIDIDQTEFLAGIEVLADVASKMLDRIEAGFDVNEGEFLAQVQALAEMAERVVRNIEAELTPEAAGFLAAVRGLAELAEVTVGDIDVPVHADASRLIPEVQAARAAAQAAVRPIDIRTRLDRDGFMRQARAFRSEAQRIANRIAPHIPVTWRGDRLRQQVERDLRYIDTQIRRLGRSTDRNYSRSIASGIERSIGRIRELGDRFTDTGRRGLWVTRVIGNLGKAASSAASKIPLTGHSLMIVALVLGLLAPALAIVSGALLTLPSLLMLAAVPAAAVALSLDGIKKAAESLKDEYESLKKVMDDSGQRAFEPVFAQLANVFPMLERALPRVNEGLGVFAQGFANALASESGQNNLENIINNVTQALKNAEPGVWHFTQGILNLFSKMSDRFPGMMDIFSELGEKFDEWTRKLTTIDEKGSTPLDRIITAMKDITGGLGEGIGGLFTKGLELLEDPVFVDNITSFFKELSTIITDSMPMFVASFNTVAESLKTIATSIEDIKTSWGALKESFSDESMFEFFKNAGLPEDVVEENKFFDIDWHGIWDSFTESMKEGWNNIDWSWFTSAGIQEKLGLNNIFGDFQVDWYNIFSVNPLLGVTTTIIENIDKIIGKLKEWFQIGSREVSQGGSFADEPWDGTGLDGGAKLFSGLDAEIDELPGKMGEAESAISGGFDGIRESITEKFSGIGEAVAGTFAEVPAAAEGSFGQISAAAETAVFGATAAFITGVNAWIQAITFGGEQVVSIVGTWPAAILSALGDLGGLLYDAGLEIANGLARGITDGTAAAVAAAQAMAAQVAAAARVELGINSPSRVFHEIGGWIDQGLADGIDSNADAPAEAMTSMIEGLDVDTDATLDEVLSKVSSMTAEMVNGIEERHGNVTINVNIGTINANQIEKVASQVEKSNEKIASSAEKAAKSQEKVYGKLDTEGRKASDGLATQIEELDLEISRLEILYDNTQNKAAQRDLDARIKSLELRKKELQYQKKAIEYENKYGESLESAIQATEAQAEAAENTGKTLAEKIQQGLLTGEEGIRSAVSQIVDAIGEEFGAEDLSGQWAEIWEESKAKDLGKTFFDENKSALYSDLGISGNGFLSRAIDEVPQYVFNVNNMDEALAAKDRETNRNMMKYA